MFEVQGSLSCTSAGRISMRWLGGFSGRYVAGVAIRRIKVDHEAPKRCCSRGALASGQP